MPNPILSREQREKKLNELAEKIHEELSQIWDEEEWDKEEDYIPICLIYVTPTTMNVGITRNCNLHTALLMVQKVTARLQEQIRGTTCA